MADFRWPGTEMPSLPFVDGTINTRYYDTLSPASPGHDPTYDPDNSTVGDVTYDSKAWVQAGWTQFSGIYPVYYNITGEGRPVYVRVAGEAEPGVVLQIFRMPDFDNRPGNGGKQTEGSQGFEPDPVAGVPGWTALDQDTSGGANVGWRRSAAWRGVLEAGIVYVIRIASYGSRGDGHGHVGEVGYDSGVGQVMYIEADYDDLDLPINDQRNNAKDVLIYDEDVAYTSAPVLNTGFTTIDVIGGVGGYGDPEALLGLQFTAWWKYTPKASGFIRAQVNFKDTEYFPGQYTPGVIYALRYTPAVPDPHNPDSVLHEEKFDFVASSKYNADNNFPGVAQYVQFFVAKGETIYFVVGCVQQFVSTSQKYVLTASGPISREQFKLRMKNNTWELLSGGPFDDRGLFNLRVADLDREGKYKPGESALWWHQVPYETRGARPLALRKKDQTWETVLFLAPGDKDRPGRLTWSIDDLGDYRYDGISLPQGYVSTRNNELSRWTYNGPDSNGHYFLVSLVPGGEQTSGVPAFYINALARSAKGWSGGVASNDFGIDVRYKDENLGWYALPLGALMAQSKAFLVRNGIDPVLNRVEITHKLYGWSVDKSQLPWMNFYNHSSTTNGLYPGVGALKQLPKQQLPDYHTVNIHSLSVSDYQGDNLTVPYIKENGRPHLREDGVILWTGNLNDLGTQGLIHGLPNKVPKVITQTLTPAFIGNYTVDDSILYEIMTSDLPDPDAMSLEQSAIYHTIENVMNHYVGVKIIYNV